MRKKLLTEDFYQKLILDPIANGCDELVGISGYVSSGFLRTLRLGAHNNPTIPSIGKQILIDVTYGMYPVDGVTEKSHDSICKLANSTNTVVRYYNPSQLMIPPNCHSKVFVWQKRGVPEVGFCGSLNWTGSAFFSTDRESVVECDAHVALKYIRRMNQNAELAVEVRDLLIRQSTLNRIVRKRELKTSIAELEKVSLPLTSFGKGLLVPEKSGLNWGFAAPRDKKNPKPRNRNEAELRIPSKVAPGFFPPKGVRFLMYTDDGESYECVVAQGNDKAIETPDNNSLLGEYFRRRLGLPSEAFVVIQDLIRYGRIDVTVAKLPNGDYLLDFRP